MGQELVGFSGFRHLPTSRRRGSLGKEGYGGAMNSSFSKTKRPDERLLVNKDVKNQ